MSRSQEENWHGLLAERIRQELVRDAIASELVRTYGPVVNEPLPAELRNAIDARRRTDKVGG